MRLLASQFHRIGRQFFHFCQSAAPKIIFLVAFIAIVSERGRAVTAYYAEDKGYIYGLSQFKPTLSIPTQDRTESLPIPVRKLQERVFRWQSDPRIEPVLIQVVPQPDSFRTLATRLAKTGKTDELAQYFADHAEIDKNPERTKERYVVALTPEILGLIDLRAVGNLLSRKHHIVSLRSRPLARTDKKLREFVEQIEPFLGIERAAEIRRKIIDGEIVTIHEDLLPRFARNMAGGYTIYRGPNCFHAALAFHSPDLTKSLRINVKEEEGYHRSMINYDELWQALKTNFSEVTSPEMPLKYGDVLIFMDKPNHTDPASFRWIRHAAVYLFDRFTFSKGSKSPNTPYSVKTLDEEWSTWSKISKGTMGVKVFRRSVKSTDQNPPKDLLDWMY